MTDDSTDNPSADNRDTGNDRDQPSHRPWRQIAEAVLRETDHEKILTVAQELCDAVDKQVLGQRNLSQRRKTGDGQPSLALSDVERRRTAAKY